MLAPPNASLPCLLKTPPTRQTLKRLGGYARDLPQDQSCSLDGTVTSVQVLLKIGIWGNFLTCVSAIAEVTLARVLGSEFGSTSQATFVCFGRLIGG